ncbi:hypothetical protein QQ045_009020 [Rhodiola kirilowii]
MSSFSLSHNPSSIFLSKFRSERRLIRHFWISRKTRLSKSRLSVGGSVKKGDCEEIESWGCEGFCRRSGLMGSTAFRSGESEGRIQVFEQEGLIGGDEKLRAVNGGLEATLNRLSKWLLSAILGVIVIWRHDGEAMWIVTGSVVNKILSNVLKRVLNQDRPVSTTKSDPGMPSSHAQSIFYAAAYIVVSMVAGLGVNALTLVLSSLVFAAGSYLSWLRVSQQFHTVSQVLVGAIMGLAFSVLWFWAWGAVVHEAYISLLWVRVCMAMGAAGFALAVIRHWLKGE